MMNKIKRAIVAYMLFCLLLFVGLTGRNCVQSNGENSAYGISTAVFLAAICRFGENHFGNECRYL